MSTDETVSEPETPPPTSNIFLQQSRSIAAKRGDLSVVLTAKLPNIFENFSNCAELLNREIIEWE